VTFDTDSIDAVFAPGTTGPKPGGFTSAEIIRIGALIGERGLTAIDNVELWPAHDPARITARLVGRPTPDALRAREDASLNPTAEDNHRADPARLARSNTSGRSPAASDGRLPRSQGRLTRTIVR
jgi:hypothetical protein